jgi:putative intracellular protease/amidase
MGLDLSPDLDNQPQLFGAFNNPLLRLQGLCVEYSTPRGPVHAVDGVTIDIGSGEFIGLAGESGCGKSTIAQAILRVLQDSELRRRLSANGPLRAADFAAIVVPGGWCPDFMRRSETMVRFIRQCAEAKIVLAAICHGGWMLCCTDALRGRRATSFFAIKYDMINAGANWVDQECVVDGNVITARKPDDLPAFCKAIMAELTA